MLRLIACWLLPVMLISGCRTFTAPARVHKLDDGVVWFDYDASRRGALMLPVDPAADAKKFRVLSEPSPDVAIGVVAEFVAKASYQGIDGNASGKVTESIAELGKRTQTIMFLREALFRLNELQTANQITPAEMTRLYEKVLDTALKLAEADRIRELQMLSPNVAERILSEDTRKLQDRFDALLRTPLKDEFRNDKIKTMADYADHLVDTTPQFQKGALYDIRAHGGANLELLIDELEKAAKR